MGSRSAYAVLLLAAAALLVSARHAYFPPVSMFHPGDKFDGTVYFWIQRVAWRGLVGGIGLVFAAPVGVAVVRGPLRTLPGAPSARTGALAALAVLGLPSAALLASWAVLDRMIVAVITNGNSPDGSVAERIALTVQGVALSDRILLAGAVAGLVSATAAAARLAR